MGPDHGRPALLAKSQRHHCAVAAGHLHRGPALQPQGLLRPRLSGGQDGGTLQRQSPPLHPSIPVGMCKCSLLSDTVASHCPTSGSSLAHTPKPGRAPARAAVGGAPQRQEQSCRPTRRSLAWGRGARSDTCQPRVGRAQGLIVVGAECHTEGWCVCACAHAPPEAERLNHLQQAACVKRKKTEES